MRALVLLAHGSRNARSDRPLAQLRDWVQVLAPDDRVVDAYLTLNQPDLRSCLRDLAAQGLAEAVVVPMFVAQGHHLNEEVPALLESLQAEFGGLRLSLSPHLGADAGLAALVMDRCAQARVLGTEAGSPGKAGSMTRVMI
ncbi:MAG TPA: CbiX/SirB N-terminal domain-containing protein [bacterium]|nr:CbiX/SirB N-terminal domain-containing protein [bacterium]